MEQPPVGRPEFAAMSTGGFLSTIDLVKALKTWRMLMAVS